MPRRLLALLALLALCCVFAACASDDPGAERAPSSRDRGVQPDGRREAAPSVGRGRDPALQTRLRAALRDRGPDYAPRTRDLLPDGTPRHVNRLIESDSPYLLQHAHNPVDWYPWGEEAFAAAKRLNRPIFLSVGYSTCHWCHVMARESFEDPEIAAYLNAHFVCIKVDREQRPDVDALYMRVVQLLTGSGGWPMTVVMTPDRDPFFGGTYFPPQDTGRDRGVMSLLRELVDAYREDASGVVARARELVRRVEASQAPEPPQGVPGPELIVRAVEQALRAHDAEHGGFGRAPKFPRPALLTLLLRYHRRARDARALQAVRRTLDGMLRGGIYDHLAGGFHRYSTDARWLVPHFEKMLYDNAQLVTLLLDAYQLTGDEDYARAARETLGYVAREMMSPDGAFYSATDADSPGPDGRSQEGYHFTWTRAELIAAVGEQDAQIVGTHFGVSDAGDLEGRSVLAVRRPVTDLAAELKMPPADVAAAVARGRRKLLAARTSRAAPPLDDKVLAGWNGLMIGAFARAAVVLGEPKHAARAALAADFVLKHMRDARGRLLRSHFAGASSHLGYLDDHAFFVAGLLDLFEATADPGRLRAARKLQAALDERFWAGDQGGYFRSSVDHERLVVRERPSYDGAEPSGNSVALMNLLRLHEVTGDRAYRSRAERLLRGFAGSLSRGPDAMPYMLAGLERYLDRPLEVFIVRPSGADADADAALQGVVRRTYLPNALTLRLPGLRGAWPPDSAVPAMRGKRALHDRPTAFVCERGRCQLPTHAPATLLEQLSQVRPLAPAGP